MPRVTSMSAWPSLTVEGNLIAPAQIEELTRKAESESEPLRQLYGIRKGLTLREEIALAFRVGQSHLDSFLRLVEPSAEATRRFVLGFLQQVLGFNDLEPLAGPVAFLAGGRVPVVVVPPDERLDRRSPTLSTDRSRSPAYALQDYLNEQDDCLWGLVTNGLQIRLMRDNASMTRPAFIEADLGQIFANEDAASFAAFWLLFHRASFGVPGTPSTECELERWREAGSKQGEAARDRLAGQVEQALRILGTGFLEANPDLAQQLRSGEVRLTDWFNELLRLVYRLIFIMVAEDRDLLHIPDASAEARKLYAEGYSLTHLREQCFRAANWDRHFDRYEGVKVVFRALTHGEPALGLPALGGLFAPGQLPHLERACLRNRAFMEALYKLSWLPGRAGVAPINWRAMETEELGSVYESLLELQPQLGEGGTTLIFANNATEQRGNQRKTTGSYYTPDSLVQALLDTTLDPVLNRVEAQEQDSEAALLKLSVLDPACGSGHFLLAAARRIATRLARIRTDGTPSPSDFRHALRDVSRHCIYGVDRNPMAVELTKVALWIETVDPGRPLGFFDAQIRCGDSLLGVFDLKVLEEGIPDAAYKPLTGDDKAVAKYYAAKNRREKAERDRIASGFGFNRHRDLTQQFAELRAMPEETVEQIEAKARRLRDLTRQGAAAYTLARACDLYVAAFLAAKRVLPQTAGPNGLPRRGAETVPTSGTVWELLRGVQPYGLLIQEAERALEGVHVFHWPLEFPDVMGRGGFDVVIGNPPWERIKLQEQEFFATRSPEIAGAPNKAARDRLIKSLETAGEGTREHAIFEAFVAAKRLAEATSEFVRVAAEDGGRFPLTGRGDVNTYALFAELFARLARERAGVIVPTGIATDATTAPFFASLVETKRLARLVDFENREAVFPSVHRSYKFCLMTLGRNEAEARFAFFLTDPAQIADSERNFTLSPETISRLNPNTRTAPVFRSRADAELTAKIYSHAPVLIDESKGKDGNPWGVSFARLFDMSNDSHFFRTAKQLYEDGFVREGTDWIRGSERYVPLYEAKMIHQFDHRWASYDESGESSFDVGLADKQNPAFEPSPRYWVPETEVESRLSAKGWSRGWLMGWRDITNATNERTVIATVFPRAGVNHKMPLFFVEFPPSKKVCLLANMNSLTFDFAARQKVGGTNLAFFYLKQLPVLPPTFYTGKILSFIHARVLEIVYTSNSLTSFVCDLGYGGLPVQWNEDRRERLRAELDAFYARAYGLTRDELRYILDPADVKGPDYPSETFRVLKEKEIRGFGEYRTRRLVLEAWDRMESSGEFRALGL